jgi:hypothetical protein
MRGKEVAWCAPHHGLLEFDPTRQQHSASTPKKMTKKSPTPSPATRVDEAAAALCASAPAAMHTSAISGKNGEPFAIVFFLKAEKTARITRDRAETSALINLYW